MNAIVNFKLDQRNATKKMFKVVTHPNLKRGHKKNNFEIVSFFSKPESPNESKQKERVRYKQNSGRCSRNKHSLSTVGSATVDVCSESESRGKVGARAQTLHTTHVDIHTRHTEEEE